jgi:ABC-type dipeptide/oligopeptide/nickel transport systems, permease components
VFRYILKRLGYTVFVIIGVSILTFLLLKLAPGDPARLMLPENATEEQVQAMQIHLGLDKPLYVQYLTYMNNVLHGDLGTSLFFVKPNAQLIAERFPATMKLAFSAVLLSLIIAIPLGVTAGVKKGTAADFFAMLFALFGQSMSSVWLGILLFLIFAVKLRVLPAMGSTGLQSLILPCVTMGFSLAALTTRMVRSGMIDVLQEDYITATYARGISPAKVIFKYAFRNAMLPTITIVGMEVGALLGGSVVVERIFGWPGIGSLTVQAIGMRDFPLVQSILLVISTIFVLVNLAVDIIYTFVDPRMKLE